MTLSNKRPNHRLRLYLSAAIALCAMLALIVFGLARLSSLGDAHDRMIGEDWTKAEAAHAINALTRANARRVMELFIATDKTSVAQTYLFIESNKQIISAKLDLLARMADSTEERRLIATIRTSRAAYVDSFSKVATLLAQDKRDQAALLLHQQTLPMLDLMQKQLERMLALQRTLVEANAAEARMHLAQAGAIMFCLCLVGVLASIAVANLVSRNLRKPPGDKVALTLVHPPHASAEQPPSRPTSRWP